jgi:hypothetical protein
MSKYKKNKPIDITSQNRRAKWYFSYVNRIIDMMMAEDDIISISTAKKVLHSTPFIYKSLSMCMSDINSIRMIQLVMNLAIITYQMFIPLTNTWFVYLTTSASGLKKIYQCIFTNPIYGFLFYGTFYLKLLEGTSDEKKFNQIAEFFNIPNHADSDVDKVLAKILDNLPSIFLDFEVKGYKMINRKFLKSLEHNCASKVANIVIEKAILTSLKNTGSEISKISYPAVYIEDMDKFDYDDREIQDQLQFLKKEHTNIKKYLNKNINSKNKKVKKKRVKQIVQLKSTTGKVICLNKCKSRIKTTSGCYCEGNCGTTTFINGKKWCWVDPEKCKKGKLNKFLGYSYDTCDNQLSKSKKCFTGEKYTDCENQ